MSNYTSGNAPNTAGTTPASEAQKTPPTTVTEAQLLEKEAAEAKKAIARVLSLIGTNAGHGIDPRVWTRAHPLVALGAAAAGGFVLVNMVPSEQERLLKRIQKETRQYQETLQKNLNPQPHNGETNGHAPPQKGGLMNGLLHEVFTIVRPTILSMIANAVMGQAQPPHQASDNVTDIPPESPPDDQPPIESPS